MGTTLTCHDNSGGREGACESSVVVLPILATIHGFLGEAGPVIVPPL